MSGTILVIHVLHVMLPACEESRTLRDWATSCDAMFNQNLKCERGIHNHMQSVAYSHFNKIRKPHRIAESTFIWPTIDVFGRAGPISQHVLKTFRGKM
jgi:hypothetical protein